ncbi:MAG: T9SS type A sorting domain-containing protein [Saprospiraceae bacterium]|nr:T9SS type A sorting domain-containing protein [Saprospiraceae bacterium]
MKVRFTLFLLVFMTIWSLSGQKWAANLPKNPTYDEVVKAFDEYWKDKPKEKGKGYKQFKRWEYYWSTRLDENRMPMSPLKVHEETKSYNERYLQSGKENSAPANWRFFGPTTTPGGYEGLGRLNCIAFHPTNNNTYWVGSPAGGLWKTTNNGQSWSTNTDYLPVIGVSDIAIDPTNPDIIYIATGDGDLASGPNADFDGGGDTKSIGVLKSTNGGQTWFYTGLTWTVSERKTIRRLWMNPNDPRTLVAVSSDGIWRTTNAGANWTRTQTGHFMDIEQKPNVNTILYAASYDPKGGAGIWLSSNGGITWTNKASIPEVIRIKLAVSKSLPNLVDAVGVNTNDGMDGLYYSENSGETWQRYFTSDASSNLLNSDYNASGEGGQGNYDLAYAINPNNPDEILLGGVNTWKSSDAGTTWLLNTWWSSDASSNPRSIPVVHADKHFIAFHPRVNNLVFECNDGGLYSSSNAGQTWVDKSNGLGISQIYRIAVSQTRNNHLMIGMQDNGSRGHNNNQWYYATGGDGMDCAIDYTNSNIQYGCYVQGVIYRTNDSWSNQDAVKVISNNIPGEKKGAWLTPIAIDPQRPNVIYAAYDDVWASTDRGDSWFRISFGLTGGVSLTAMAISPSNPNYIYVATRNALIATTNAGQNWALIAESPNSPINFIAVDPKDPNRVYITLGGYNASEKVFVTPDGGKTWVNYTFGLPNVPVNCIIYENGSNEGLYVGTDIGVFYTDASKNDWEPFQNGLPNVIVADLDISYQDKKLWAGTYGRGVWSSNLYSAVSTKDQVRSDFKIYPVPGNGDFSIELPIDVIAKSFELIDLNGQKQTYLQQLQGKSQFEINTLAPCGLYCVRITTDKGVFQRKVIIQ